MSIENPLGLQDLLVNTISGSIEIFTFLMIAFLAVLAGRFQMPKSIFLVMLALFGIFFSEYMGGLYLIIMLLAGFVIFSSAHKAFS